MATHIHLINPHTRAEWRTEDCTIALPVYEACAWDNAAFCRRVQGAALWESDGSEDGEFQ